MPADVLSTVSWAAETLSREPRQLFHVVRVLLSDLRRATGMDGAELYLADPQQSVLILSGYAGKDAEAFLEKCVFHFGEGFPGLAAAGRQIVETRNLESDERYLRERVRALGYHAFLSYPLLLPHAVVGVLNLAARDVRQVEAAKRNLALISPLLAASLYAVMTSLGERTLERVRQARTPRDRALALLEDSLEASSGLRAALRPLHGEQIETHPDQMRPCGCDGKAPCPAQAGQICVSGMAELPCAALPVNPHVVCLPVWDAGEVKAVTTVQFSARGDLHAESVAPLLWISRLAAGALELPTTAAAPETPVWLDIETLGAFRIRRGGEVLSPKDFRRRQAYQLLKLLVTRWGRPLHTDELCEALWPGEGVDERVLARLHVTLNALRQVVEPPDASGGRAEAQVILRDGNAYRFAPTVAYRLDSEQFETLVRQADGQTGAAALGTYALALALYRGDFMEDDPYSDAFALERDYLRELAVRSLFRAAELQEAAGLNQDVLASYSQILAIDPQHFEAHEALITFLVKHGRVEDAQLRWERYARAFGGAPRLPAPAQQRSRPLSN